VARRGKNLPGLNKTIAFKHANSVGSTCRGLKRLNTSWRTLRSEAEGLPLPCPGGERSGRDSRGQLSRGSDHWIAQSRNSSLHASSSRITWNHKNGGLKLAVINSERLLGQLFNNICYFDRHWQIIVPAN